MLIFFENPKSRCNRRGEHEILRKLEALQENRHTFIRLPFHIILHIYIYNNILFNARLDQLLLKNKNKHTLNQAAKFSKREN